MCHLYQINSSSYTLENEKSGQAVCPYDPQHNSTAVFVGKYNACFAAVSNGGTISTKQKQNEKLLSIVHLDWSFICDANFVCNGFAFALQLVYVAIANWSKTAKTHIHTIYSGHFTFHTGRLFHVAYETLPFVICINSIANVSNAGHGTVKAILECDKGKEEKVRWWRSEWKYFDMPHNIFRIKLQCWIE